jgi:3-oxoacyl-[acyl-carrier protein] reductase
MDRQINDSTAVALVTGGSRGMGRGIGVELARADSTSCSAIQRGGRRRKRHGLPSRGYTTARVEIFRADISDRGRARHYWTYKKRFGQLDALVNNAGIAPEACRSAASLELNASCSQSEAPYFCRRR